MSIFYNFFFAPIKAKAEKPICSFARNLPKELLLKKESLNHIDVSTSNYFESSLFKEINEIKNRLKKAETRKPMTHFEPKHPVLKELKEKFKLKKTSPK